MTSWSRIGAWLLLMAVPGCAAHPPQPAVVSPARAAGTTPGPLPQFRDVTASAGIRFRHNNGAFGERLMPESVGCGLAFIDYDSDGDQDVFFVNSRYWSDQEAAAYRDGKWSKLELASRRALSKGQPLARMVPPDRKRHATPGVLYRNDGDGTFTDATAGSGVDTSIFGMGATVGDYDNNGHTDLYVTGYPRNYLFHNLGGGKFREVAGEAGVVDRGWGTSAAFVDYDRDGLLDLFVCHYVRWSPAIDVWQSSGGGLGPKSYAGPTWYEGQVSRLYRNTGQGRFRDVSVAMGIHGGPDAAKAGAQRYVGKGLGVAICDYNLDNWPDILVANDMERNFLFRNEGGKRFTEVAKAAGIAYSQQGKRRAGMGIDTADIDHSGRESVVIGNFSKQMLGLYQNRGAGLFVDVAPETEVGRASYYFLTFGLSFLDMDNDGWQDIFVANGHVQDDIARVNRGVTYAERPLLFHNLGGQFREVGLRSGEAMRKPVVARGMAYADIDRDGDLDVALSTNAGPARVLRNDGGNRNRSIRLELRGTRSNRSGIGAKIVARVGSETLHRWVRSGSSYLSQSELPVTLGLGRQPHAETITINWPSGSTTALKGVAAGQHLVVAEGKGVVMRRSLAGAKGGTGKGDSAVALRGLGAEASPVG